MKLVSSLISLIIEATTPEEVTTEEEDNGSTLKTDTTVTMDLRWVPPVTNANVKEVSLSPSPLSLMYS